MPLLAPYAGHQVEYTEGPVFTPTDYCFDAECSCGWFGSWADPESRDLETGAHVIGIPEAAE